MWANILGSGCSHVTGFDLCQSTQGKQNSLMRIWLSMHPILEDDTPGLLLQDQLPL